MVPSVVALQGIMGNSGPRAELILKGPSVVGLVGGPATAHVCWAPAPALLLSLKGTRRTDAFFFQQKILHLSLSLYPSPRAATRRLTHSCLALYFGTLKGEGLKTLPESHHVLWAIFLFPRPLQYRGVGVGKRERECECECVCEIETE